ncbi:hypothetical protein H920_08665 [Fukomys damarensis]|uniref:Uncharacterized protein n=1 Tax=Fukomys damarensis TaxID=885580 RepID=A0A091E4A7_FUKDA|nr:hypothetical protein H920_08665 [Fukomys damarensis]
MTVCHRLKSKMIFYPGEDQLNDCLENHILRHINKGGIDDTPGAELVTPGAEYQAKPDVVAEAGVLQVRGQPSPFGISDCESILPTSNGVEELYQMADMKGKWISVFKLTAQSLAAVMEVFQQGATISENLRKMSEVRYLGQPLEFGFSSKETSMDFSMPPKRQKEIELVAASHITELNTQKYTLTRAHEFSVL